MKRGLVAFVCLSTFVVSAQTREIVVIDRGSNQVEKTERIERKSGSDYRNVQHKQVIKFDPVRMAIGEINFGYERVVGEKSSLDFEIGPTISDIGFYRNIGVNYGGINFQNESAIGWFGSAAFRYYPLENYYALNRFYVSPKFKYRLYRENSVVDGDVSTLTSKMNRSEDFVFSFNFGMQQWLAETFSLDYYIGFGISGTQTRAFTPTSFFDGTNNTWSEQWKESNRSNSTFILTAGLKVGIGR